jgi:hypothetical protein
VRSERGDSLVEVVIAVAIVAVGTAALLAGAIEAAHRFGPDPVQTILREAVQREMRVAVDVLKYQGSAIAPATVATTIPMPGATPAAAHVSIVTAQAGTGIAITIQASLDGSAAENASLTTTVPQPAPLPSSTISVEGNAPQ